MPFDDQRVEIIERIGKFNDYYVFIDFRFTYRAFKKHRCKIGYRVDFIVAYRFERFNDGRERHNRFVDIEIECFVDKVTYLRVFIQIFKFGVNRIEYFAL